MFTKLLSGTVRSHRSRLVAATLCAAPVLLALSMPWLAGAILGSGSHGHAVKPKPVELAGIDARGHVRTLADFHDRFVYLLFGYTGCVSVCPVQVSALRELDARLDDDTLAFVFVSIDRERDTAARLGAYFDEAGVRFTSLRTADAETLRTALRSFDEWRADTRPDASGQIVHAARLYLIGTDGRLLIRYTNPALGVAELVSDLEAIRGRIAG